MTSLFAFSLILLGVASLAGLAPSAAAMRSSLGIAALASALALVAAVAVVSQNSPIEFTLWSPAPYAQLALRLDPLGAVFAAIIAGTGVAAAVFGTGYARPRPLDDALFPLFLLSMLIVAAAANVYTFLAGWEGMALISFLLVLGDGSPRPRRQAAILYLVMTHVATVLVAAAFFIVARAANSTTFLEMHGAGLSRPMASLAFMCAVVGFGTKAGLVPLHIWLPRAHPVAPSHVSALMSAAMVKTGLYGLIRVAFVFLGPGEPWWGMVLMAVGGASAVLGVLWALMEHDMKRILAYSTVENVGIITVAIGAALTLRAENHAALASVAIAAALLHAINHAWFKTLLFLGAGSVQRAAHSLNIDRAGGLARRMPLTGGAVLVGCLAIAALPPLNGFASEWMVLRSLVDLGASDSGDGSRLLALAVLAGLALASGLAVACFVRFYGIAFLGLPRSEEAASATESAPSMHVVLGALALGCVATGIAAPWIVRWLEPVPLALFGTRGATPDHARLTLASGATLSPAVFAAALIVLAPLPWIFARALYGVNRRARGPIWATGMRFRPSMQYTGTSFSKPIRLFFSRVLLPERRIEVSYHGSSPLPRLVRYSGRVPGLFEERVYTPARALVVWTAGRLRLLQNGSVQVYLLYIMTALVALLLVTR
jgi:hydrogenase-4 component B